MDRPPDSPKWRPEYSVAALLGVIYIALLGLFTWLFNHSL